MIVEQGLEEGERLYLTIPEEGEKYKLHGEELIAVVKERKKQKAEEDRKSQNKVMPAGMSPDMTPEQRRAFMQNLTPEQREAMRAMRGGTGTGQVRQQGAAGSDSTAKQNVVVRTR